MNYFERHFHLLDKLLFSVCVQSIPVTIFSPIMCGRSFFELIMSDGCQRHLSASNSIHSDHLKSSEQIHFAIRLCCAWGLDLCVAAVYASRYGLLGKDGGQPLDITVVTVPNSI